MLTIFRNAFLILFITTAILLLIFLEITDLEISILELLSSHASRMILLVITEAVIAFVIAYTQKRDQEKLQRFLEEQEQDPAQLSRLQKRTDSIGTLANALAQFTSSNNEVISDLMAQQRYLASILENLNDGICIVDNNGKVSVMNQATAKLFNIPESKASGQALAETIRHFKVQELWEQCKQTQLQQSIQMETSVKRNYLQCIATPLEPIEDGNILLLFQDITRVHQLEIVRRDFVSNISHELRTPLTSLKLITETLQDSAMDDVDAQKRFLSQMETEIDNLTQLVQELLELSRIESGLFTLQKNPIQPYILVRDASQRMQVQAQRAGLDFSWGCSLQLPLITADKSRLEQVLINLIHNAIKFTPPGGSILVKAEQEDKHIVFSVQDTGVGIPEQDIERIFERFYKTDRSRSQKGTGLGLSISRHLVEAHKGNIWVESGTHRGSTFYFSIPLT